ncbi:MAG: biotin carboxylase N-terminal domain-containing protein [Pseudomonadota bacterium]|nr:biotin carboxylase N-terminal domain-containing protein [Pseudomonadota bacterium]
MKLNQKTYPLEGLNPLIIGRGPVRLEAVEVFTSLHVKKMGILLSRQDAYAYPYAQAPELKCLPENCHVHLVDDYIPHNESIHDFLDAILAICKQEGYRSVFAGYGFFSENPALAKAVQDAGLYFIGPSASVSEKAGAKDKAKITAKSVGASCVPGENALLGLAYMMQDMAIDDFEYFSFSRKMAEKWCEKHQGFDGQSYDQILQQLQRKVENGLNAHEQLVDDKWVIQAVLFSLFKLWKEFPTYSIRIKAIYGGGGKGQRVIAPETTEEHIKEALQSVWIESNVNSTLSNKSCVIELNIESIRHWEVQLIGNGRWCVALGGRDCSIQRHEQKLIEFSLSEATLKGQDLETLKALQADAIKFGRAVGLDSVSTYEAIVNTQDQRHFFMEMNTRLQVEHRVSELLYGLRFSLGEQTIYVDHLIHVMALLAVYGHDLPEPELVPKHNHSLEVRINAMNKALKPAPGGLIESWSQSHAHEIRDDQGISRLNPDTDYPMPYFISGSYDSNLALSLVVGHSFDACVAQMLHVLNLMDIAGRHVELNREALIGMLSVIQARQSHWHAPAVFSTAWAGQYLVLAAHLQLHLNELQLAQLNPHRVIAWALTGDDAILWPFPGCIDSSSLAKLKHLLADFKIIEKIQPEVFTSLQITPSAELILDPPVEQGDGEIRSPQSGVYYGQSAPGEPAFITLGQLIKKGETLYIIEAMKMFNTIKAPFDMIVEDLFFENTAVVQKGDVICKFRHA